MKSINLKAIAAVAMAAFSGLTASAQIPTGYYDSLKGKKGAALKNAVHEIIKDADVLTYGSGSGHTWEGFYTTDNDNGYVVDRYSNEQRRFGSKGAVVSGMNIEHSFPKSWWGGDKNQAYQDLYNLMPSDSKANSSKSNYGMGEVANATYDNGCIKVGSSSQNSKVKMWQPSKEWEGDFSRGYMYMATAYQNLTWTGEGLNSLEQGDYPTLKQWAYTLYIKWAKEDPVSAKEVARNNEVYKIQGNRNPFIDFPNLMEYIWGDSVSYAFDPNTTLCSSSYNGNGGVIDPTDPVDPAVVTLYSADFTASDGGCSLELTQNPSEAYKVWTLDSKYGWKASGYLSASKTNAEADGSVVLPEIDLTDYASATLSFEHALNYCSVDPETMLSVEVRADGNTANVQGISWPSGNSWTFKGSGDIDLSQFAGKKIVIAFHYTSNTTTASTWEIKNATVTGRKAATSVSAIANGDEAIDLNRPYSAYTTDGKRVSDVSNAKGVVIVRQNGKTAKIAVR